MTVSRRHALRRIGLALALGVSSPGPAVAQDPTDAPEILMEVRIERGPSRVVFARVAGDRVHLTGREVLELAGAEILRAVPDSVLAFRLARAESPILIATAAGYLERDGRRTALPGWSATWIEGVLYLESTLVGELLGVAARVDLAGLSVSLLGGAHLPAVAQATQEEIDARRLALIDAPDLLLELRFERGPGGLVLARAIGGRTWVAAIQVVELAQVRIAEYRVDSALALMVEPEGTRVTIDTRRGLTTRGDARQPLPPLGALWIDDALYVDLDLLARLLDVGASANLAELTITMRNAAHLPAVARVLREQRRARLRTDGRPTEGALRPPPRGTPLVGGAVLDWAAQLSTAAPAGPGKLTAESGALQLGIGAGLFGGSALLIHEERWLPSPAGNSGTTDASWTRVWPTNTTIRQVRIGEVSGTGRQPRQIQGAAVTNAPFVRPVTFAGGVLRGALPVGWEVELYRQGALVGLTTVGPDGQYGFDVPLVYGTNPVEVVGYGPTGEVRRFARTFEVPFERLPAGQFEYGLGAGGCGIDPCQATANVDLRYGATRRLTLRAGWDQFWRDSLPDLWYPYGSATFQATRSLALFAEVVGNAQLAGLASFAPTPDLRANLSHTRFLADSGATPVVGTTAIDHLTTVSFFIRPADFTRRVYLRVDGRRSIGSVQWRYDGQITATARVHSFRLDVGMRMAHVSTRRAPFTTTTLLSLQTLYQTGPAFGPLRRTILRAGIEVDPDSGLAHALAGLARSLFRDYYLDATVAWDRDLGVVASIGFKADLPSLRFSSQNRVDDFGTVGLQSVEGSLMYDGDGRRLAVGNGRGIGRAGITGTVFLDRNGNGARDPDEPPVVGARIRVGPWVAEADASGRYTVWDVVPFETLLIEVDAGSAADPQWVPAALRFAVRPDPNQFVPVDIPFVPTVEVMGEVRQAPEGVALAGVDVVFEPEDGSEPYTARSFADGAFYLMGVRPGVYRVTVSPETRRAFDLEVEDLLIEITAGQTGMVEGIVVWVR